ncbi:MULTISPECIES: hypothetical protein [Rhodococcus]|uniref:Uncharacterized protein n=1 Tax=Rhodococcus pyridinivorans TaxID=103816 RepID=A0A7M2XIZ1_9NOCA|nr:MULTISPECIES: hypothetical protein [Rhodococcus]APE09718.1 hypothetical protein BO226_11295 [Rhodococcus sp. 2G]QOV97619.1 hypothetical protein INP59_16990 [Rhodococcus pyridinivorans]
MSRPSIRRVKEDLEYLQEAWPSLVALRVPGTARSWVENPRRAGMLSPEDQERLGKRGFQTPAPADIQVLDLIWSIANQARDIVECMVEVIDAGRDYVPAESSTRDPRPWLETARELIDAAQKIDEATLPWVACQIAPLVKQTAHLLGDFRDGQVLNGICPWCNGRGDGGMVGLRTMQLHYPDPDEEDDQPLVVCRGVNCDPPRGMVGMRWRGRPAWTRREWDWLAKMLRDPEAEPGVVEKVG